MLALPSSLLAHVFSGYVKINSGYDIVMIIRLLSGCKIQMRNLGISDSAYYTLKRK